MRLHVQRSGSGSPALVFVHGLGGTAATWDGVVALLSASHLTIAVDLLGHGRSPVPEDPALYTRDAALADLDDVLATIDGPAVLVGHSLGGYLSLAHAATRRGVAAGVIVLNTGPGFRDPDKREGWNERSRRNAHRFGVPIQATNLNLQEDSVVMERLAEMTVPTLVLAGSADREEYTVSGQYLERKMPHARLQVIDGGEHNMQESHAADVAAAIEAFVAELSPSE
jgi:pimeloyl-ACP methyl ester carboxylesterase